jgi:hypothetical protein
MSEKLSLYEVKKLPFAVLSRIINKAKKYLETDDAWLTVCKEHDISPDIIYLIPTAFANIDTSAKTDHGVVLLSWKLLCDPDIHDVNAYLSHEYTHWVQQCLSNHATKGSDDGEYLNNRYEQEAFSNQVSYIDEHKGENAAENYVDNLIEYHEVPKSDKKEIKDVLMSKV